MSIIVRCIAAGCFLIGLVCASFNQHIEERLSNHYQNGSMQEAYYIFGEQKHIAKPEYFDAGISTQIKSNHPSIYWKHFWNSHLNNFYEKELKQHTQSLNNLIDVDYNTFFLKTYHEHLHAHWTYYKQEIDTLSIQFQKNGLEINIINNSQDTLLLQSSLAYPICVKQAKDQYGQWRDVEFYKIKMSGCFAEQNFEYFPIPPGKAWSILTHNQHHGGFQTQLRYKILAKDQFLYSPVFNGYIRESDFNLSGPYISYMLHLPLDKVKNWADE